MKLWGHLSIVNEKISLQQKGEIMKKYKIGFLCGFFDILHEGHIDILSQAKEQCEYLIVAVGTDEFMKRRKGRESVMPYTERVHIMKAIRYVDEVVPENDLDKIKAYHEYNFDVMFAGADHLNEEIYQLAEKELKHLGVDVIYVPRIIEESSTDLRMRAAKVVRESLHSAKIDF